MRDTKKIINNKKINAPAKNEALSPAIYKSMGNNSVEVSYNKSSELDDCFKKLGGELKVSLEKRFKSKFPLNKIWQCDEFKIVNPTSIPCSFNLFDGFSITPVPNTPNGYVPNLNPLGIPVMNFPPSAGSSYPSYECATVSIVPPAPDVYTDPLAVTYVPSTDRIYVTVFDGVAGCRVLIINPNTNLILSSFILGLGGLSWMSTYSSVSNKVYVTDQSVSIVPIDCATELPLAAILLPAPASQISYSAANNYLYVTVPSLGSLYYIDCATDTIVGFIPLGSVGITALVNWSNGVNNYAVVLDVTSSTAYYINTTLNTIISSFVITNFADGFGAICYNSIKDTIYYLDNLGVVREINMATQTMLGTAILGVGGSYQLLFTALYNTIHVAKRAVIANADVVVINCVTNVIDLVIPTSVTFVTGGSRLAYDNVNNSIWVTGNGANLTVSKLCGTTGTCYIVGSTDYNEFLQYLRNDPICVRQLQFFSQSLTQLTVPLELQTKDANGNMCTIPKLPNITISADQFQPNIATVDFHCKDLILDCLTTINNYTIAPNSELTFLIYYDQIYKVDILSSKETICKRLTDIKCANVSSRDEFTVQFNTQRPHVRPKWLKPFSATEMGKKINNIKDADINDGNNDNTGSPTLASNEPKIYTMNQLSMKQVKRLDKSNMDNIFEEIDSENKLVRARRK
jgi:hypothetical protein